MSTSRSPARTSASTGLLLTACCSSSRHGPRRAGAARRSGLCGGPGLSTALVAIGERRLAVRPGRDRRRARGGRRRALARLSAADRRRRPRPLPPGSCSPPSRRPWHDGGRLVGDLWLASRAPPASPAGSSGALYGEAAAPRRGAPRIDTPTERARPRARRRRPGGLRAASGRCCGRTASVLVVARRPRSWRFGRPAVGGRDGRDLLCATRRAACGSCSLRTRSRPRRRHVGFPTSLTWTSASARRPRRRRLRPPRARISTGRLNGSLRPPAGDRRLRVHRPHTGSCGSRPGSPFPQGRLLANQSIRALTRCDAQFRLWPASHRADHAHPAGGGRRWLVAALAARHSGNAPGTLAIFMLAAPIQLGLTVAWHFADASPTEASAIRGLLQSPVAGLAGVIFPLSFLYGTAARSTGARRRRPAGGRAG